MSDGLHKLRPAVAEAGRSNGPLLTVVSPCYNEADVLPLFFSALMEVLDGIDEVRIEVIFIDDGSTDDTLSILNRFADQDPRVRVGSLSRNFGHQIALTAGLDYAAGDAVIMMDCDLQHPPEVVPKLVEKWLEGFDIVSAIREHTKGISLFKRLTSSGFYVLINYLSSTNMPFGVADFCLISRRVCKVLQSMRERHRFLRGMISWVGYPRALVAYEANERAAGKSKYTVVKMVGMAIDAVLSFSTTPIRLATRLGFLITVLGFAYLGWNLIRAFALGYMVPGWASLIGLTMILGGSQLIFIGIIGQYLARVFEESKARPMYVLKQEPKELQYVSHPAKAPAVQG